MPVRDLQMVREGMWAVVNEQGGTAPQARLPDPKVQLAGKTGSSQVRRVSREQREDTNFDSAKLPWEFRPHALFVAFAPYDAPRYAVSVVIEHGNAGAAAAAPVARDIMIDTLGRDPSNRTHPPGAEVAQGPMPAPMPLAMPASMRGPMPPGVSTLGARPGGTPGGIPGGVSGSAANGAGGGVPDGVANGGSRGIQGGAPGAASGLGRPR
jgi:hypothetical protein